MLLSRYNSLDYVFNLFWFEGLAIIQKAIEKTVEQKDWEMWLVMYPTFSKETFIPFDKFRTQKTKKSTKKELTNQEIIEQAESTRLLHQGKHKGIVRGGG